MEVKPVVDETVTPSEPVLKAVEVESVPTEPELEEKYPSKIVGKQPKNLTEYEVLIEKYAKQNPKKYALKKAELEKKLAAKSNA